jgi:hypothetical protein
MDPIEQLRSAFSTVPFASDRRWSLVTLVPGRLHLSRGEIGEFAIFLEGERESFGPIPSNDGVQHTSDLVALPDGERVSALFLRSTDVSHGDSVLAHIGYELVRALGADPSQNNRTLLKQVRWILPLLGTGVEILTPERQRGLIGECILLRELLLRARALGKNPSDVLLRWWGHLPAQRDFAGTQIAIEVKTTTMLARQHQIGSLAQLQPQAPGEEIYVYSVGLKSDASSSRKLPVYVEEVEQLLVSEDGIPSESSIELFDKQLRAYGYDVRRRSLYDTELGYLRAIELPARLYREADLDRLRPESFVDGRPPSMVTSVSYTLNITCEPLSRTDTLLVLDRLLHAAPPTVQ